MEHNIYDELIQNGSTGLELLWEQSAYINSGYERINEENSLEPVEFNVPSSWLSALINGDESGFDYHGDEREYETYKKFVRDVANEHGNAHFQHVSDEGFSRASSFDVDTLNGDMSVVSILVKRNRLNEGVFSKIKDFFTKTPISDYSHKLASDIHRSDIYRNPASWRIDSILFKYIDKNALPSSAIDDLENSIIDLVSSDMFKEYSDNDQKFKLEKFLIDWYPSQYNSGETRRR